MNRNAQEEGNRTMSIPTDNNVRDFSLNLNVAGVSAATGGAELLDGYYKAVVSDMYIAPEKANRVVIKVRVSEGPNTGAVRTTGLNLPSSDSDGVRAYWRALLESVGYTAAQLDNGQVTLGPDAIVGRTAHIFYQGKNEAEGRQYDRVSFFPPALWLTSSASYQPEVRPATVASAPAAAPAATRLGGGAPSTVTPGNSAALGSAATTSSILSRLGGGNASA